MPSASPSGWMNILDMRPWHRQSVTCAAIITRTSGYAQSSRKLIIVISIPYISMSAWCYLARRRHEQMILSQRSAEPVPWMNCIVGRSFVISKVLVKTSATPWTSRPVVLKHSRNNYPYKLNFPTPLFLHAENYLLYLLAHKRGSFPLQ